MEIFIKGVDMPREGTVLVIDSAGQVWSNEWPTRGYTRLDGVTAVPVPPHGRLIDADALEKDGVDIHEDVVCCGYVEDSIWGFSHEMIENAPTIIQATGEE